MDNSSDKKQFSSYPEKKKLSGAKRVTTEVKKMLFLSEDAGVPPIDISKYIIDLDLLRLVPGHIARSYKIIPLAKIGSVLTVAMVDPFEVFVMDNLKIITKCSIQSVVATSSDIKRAQNNYYRTLEMEQLISDDNISQEKIENPEEKANVALVANADDVFDIEEMTKISKDAAIVNMVNTIIKDATKSRASDIHIEPYSDVLRLRFRVDGVMREMTPLFRENANAIIARIKVMSGLDITIRSVPQDGRFSSKFGEREIDFRVSILPIHFGEKAVLRLLDKGSITMDLDGLGYSQHALNAFKGAIARPYGMILLTGPTGSGKSTTLYSLMNKLNTPQKHLVTVEDPVEYQVKGLTQIQVKPDIGLSFSSALRAVLRQSPDVLMVGEIRDHETVDIAMKAALTGHIVLSTLHTNDAPSAIVRLMDMQVEPFLIASTLILIAAQRLTRKVCLECKEPVEVDGKDVTGLPDEYKTKKVVFYQGRGCKVCNNSGYFGRVAVVETLIVDDNIKQMILKSDSMDRIREYGRRHGMRTLREDAIEKGLKGEISLEEILRVTPEG